MWSLLVAIVCNFKGFLLGLQICFCYNEDTLTIVDVTDKDNMRMIARQGYTGVLYTHQVRKTAALGLPELLSALKYDGPGVTTQKHTPEDTHTHTMHTAFKHKTIRNTKVQKYKSTKRTNFAPA